MIDDKYLTEKEMNKKHLMTLTKEELVTHLLSLNTLRLELTKNLDEYHVTNEHLQQTNNQLCAENKELTEKNEILWKVVQKGLDLKEMLDDAEDIAEELRELSKELYD